MEAKDTVMPELYTKSIYMGSDYHPSFKLPLEMKHSLDRVTQAQAEISFPEGKQAGIREVVEFYIWWEFGQYGHDTELDIAWQDKLKVWFKDNPELLKEWGLEGE